MAVVYDTHEGVTGVVLLSLTTAAFTITSNADRAALIVLSPDQVVTAITTSVGGVSGTPFGPFTNSPWLFSVIAPPTGSQTATASWTTASNATLNIVTASGVDQTTPVNNATDAAATSADATANIPSNAGDLTVAAVRDVGSVAFTASTQTERWSASINTLRANGSTGPGTAGPITHAWTNTSVAWRLHGANFVVAGAAPPGQTFFPRIDDAAGRGRYPTRRRR
jgi:hypothetical protein